MTESRATYRKAFADLLRTQLNTDVQAVFSYQVGDFKGKSPVIVVTGSGTQRPNPTTFGSDEFFLEVHTFVLYALEPLQLTQDVLTGTDVLVSFTDTSMFLVDQVVLLEGPNGSEQVVISAIDDDVSITLSEVVDNYVAPKLYVWTEEMSEDAIDYLEQQVSDTVRASNNEDLGLSVRPNGQSEVDVVEIGGDGYRHEMIPVVVTVPEV
jgi:hypothetical protein